MRVLNYQKYLPEKIGSHESFKLPTTSSKGKDLNQYVALQVTKGGKPPNVVAIGTITEFEPPDAEADVAGQYTVSRIRLLESPFEIPFGQKQLGKYGDEIAKALYDPGITLRSVYYSGPEHILCESCGNTKCPFWQRLHYGDRSHFWAAVNGVRVCPSKVDGKPKKSNFCHVPPAEVIRQAGVEGAFNPLNGLSYTWSPSPEEEDPALRGNPRAVGRKLLRRQDTLASVSKAKPDSQVYLDAIATRGDASLIEREWCKTCKKKGKCPILQYKQKRRGQTICVDDWVYWNGRPVCVAYENANPPRELKYPATPQGEQLSLLPQK